MARTSWIVLLGYLAFVGVTLLAVEDADFFVPTRQTQLPLIDVSIPTASFFIFAPVLAAALYIYLHIILLKLWDAIADVNEPAIDGQPARRRLDPWLVNDWALSIKGGRLHPRPPAPRPRQPRELPPGLGRRAAGALLLLAGWSMPAHDPWLTLLLAACFLIALAAGITSWQTAHAWLAGKRHHRASAPGSGPAPSSAFRTGAGPARRARAARARRRHWRAADLVSRRLPRLRHATPHRLAAQADYSRPSARADLDGVEMVDLPAGWRDWETARASFRETWCKREGLEMAVCGQPPDPDATCHRADRHDRGDWCGKHGIAGRASPATEPSPTSTRASSRLADGARERHRRSPQARSRGRDLRRAARIGDATLVGADLGGARLEGADLRGRAAGGGGPPRGAAGGGGPRRGAAGGGGPRRGAAGGGEPQRGAAGGGEPRWARLEGADLGRARLGGEPRRGAAGGGGPPLRRFQQSLGRRIKPGVAGPVCRFSRRARA